MHFWVSVEVVDSILDVVYNEVQKLTQSPAFDPQKNNVIMLCVVLIFSGISCLSQQTEGQCTSVHTFVHCLSMPWAALGNELAQ